MPSRFCCRASGASSWSLRGCLRLACCYRDATALQRISCMLTITHRSRLVVDQLRICGRDRH
eukprot:6178358-Pleurochrysis_carterae.AAC.2